jgi:CheY-like chemotaxis protein
VDKHELGDSPVLLVEDNPDHVVLIQRTLKKANFARPVVVVVDGESALDYFMGRGPYCDRQLHPLPALVLLDLKLPRMSGLDVLEWVHQQPGLKRLPIVVLTTFAGTL